MVYSLPSLCRACVDLLQPYHGGAEELEGADLRADGRSGCAHDFLLLRHA